MSTVRLPMRKLRELIRLKFDAQLTNRTIAAALNISASTVSYYARAAKSVGLSWPAAKSMSDSELMALLEAHCKHLKKSRIMRNVPDWQQIHQELQSKHVTLTLLYGEYKEKYSAPHLGYSRFCQSYKEWCRSSKCTMTISHKPGDKCFIDYCGQTIPIYSRDSDEVRQAQIFVATLGASNYTYAEASWSQSLVDWISSNINALSFFGGSPALLVPDNLKSAVADSNKYDPVINPTYAEFAEHYNLAILPARPYSPQDKGKVENAVLLVERWILARLRKQKFYSLRALNQAIKELLTALNNKPFQKKSGSRRSCFIEFEQAQLKPLPKIRYEMARFKKAKVGKNYHVCISGSYYSVPYNMVGSTVTCRITANTIEVLHDNKRITSHVKSSINGETITNKLHMPKHHLAHSEWSVQQLFDWAKKGGDAIYNITQEFMTRCQHQDQGYRYHLGLKQLAQRYSLERLNGACLRALAIGSTSYQSLSSILKTGLDKEEYLIEVKTKPIPSHANIRGHEYYQPLEK